jgi:hypothetical protein
MFKHCQSGGNSLVRYGFLLGEVTAEYIIHTLVFWPWLKQSQWSLLWDGVYQILYSKFIHYQRRSFQRQIGPDDNPVYSQITLGLDRKGRCLQSDYCEIASVIELKDTIRHD